MPNAKDQVILKSALSGDWQSRVTLFRRFFWRNPRARQFAATPAAGDAFLHDCFTNAMRTGQSYDEQSELSEWVTSVIEWTALDRQRMRSSTTIRMCAAVESDDAGRRARKGTYVPPASGAGNLVHDRIADVVGGPAYTFLVRRGVEDKSWQDVAAGQPLTSIGPIVVRAVDRLIRYFGAPPPLNADLEPVFVAAVKDDAATTHGDPLKLKGRILPMQVDPGFYAPTPEMRAIGVSLPSEVRTVTLWDAARASSPPDARLDEHLKKCSYCAETLRSMILMQQALQSGPGVEFMFCPGGYTLLTTINGEIQELDEHLAKCAVCNEERKNIFLDRSDAPRKSGAWNPKILWPAAALVVLGAASLGWYLWSQRQTGPENPVAQEQQTDASASKVPNLDLPKTPYAINPRYRDLAQFVSVYDPRIAASVLPGNEMECQRALSLMASGNVPLGMMIASGLKDRDPGARLLFAIGLFTQEKVDAGYREVLVAEAMQPRQAIRCWSSMQCALMVGDLQTVERETDHLASDPDLGPRAKSILARAKAR